ncbi:putative G-protein coupled receptor [Sesbania bispinosa]|nr:putative G-protein coupled receptor [Sesbania bispinosa]
MSFFGNGVMMSLVTPPEHKVTFTPPSWTLPVSEPPIIPCVRLPTLVHFVCHITSFLLIHDHGPWWRRRRSHPSFVPRLAHHATMAMPPPLEHHLMLL